MIWTPSNRIKLKITEYQLTDENLIFQFDLDHIPN
jgi:hypothetical protein